VGSISGMQLKPLNLQVNEQIGSDPSGGFDFAAQDEAILQGQIYLNERLTEENTQHSADTQALWEAERQAFLNHTDFLQTSYVSSVNTMFNADMTGAQKRDAIWNQFRAGVVNKIAQVTSSYIFGELAKQHASKLTSIVGISASNAHTAAETANSATRTGSYMGEAYAKLVAFYSFLGPFAPAAAVGTIGVAIAGIGTIIASAMGAMKFQEGGLVPGIGSGDRVPALLEPGEMVMTKNATQKNFGALQVLP